MSSKRVVPNFDISLGCLLSRHNGQLATQLSNLSGLSDAERNVIITAGTRFALVSLHRKLGRVLLLELNAARVLNRLDGATSEERWQHFIERSSRREFWSGLSAHYPTLEARIGRILCNVYEATLRFGRRWAQDREMLADLCGETFGEITALEFGKGDSHCGGQTVAVAAGANATVVYKPRSLSPERTLRAFIEKLKRKIGRQLFVSVPKVLDVGEYGWAEYISHRYAAPSELKQFYEGIGQWLAIMRLLSGTDLHSENLIAHGATPYLVDCETLLSPKLRLIASGLGDATDKAASLVCGTVLGTGLLPSRNQMLGGRGLDVSGLGALPGQQPGVLLPSVINAGTDEAKIGIDRVEMVPVQNHPTREPSLADFWPDVLKGFDEVTLKLRELDACGTLEPLLKPFEDCRVRVVVRSTAAYAELMHMLWHPVSLHDEEKGRARCRDLLSKMAEKFALPPSDKVVIAAEIESLLCGDVPYFSTIARHGSLSGPLETRYLSPQNLVEAALQHWRCARVETERNYICAALVSAYLDDGWKPDAISFHPKTIRSNDLDHRRRRYAAEIMRAFVATAIKGSDGTATWVAPTFTFSGWAVQPLNADLYSGISGVAVLTGAYLREQSAGRADEIDGVSDLHARLLRTLAMFEDKLSAGKREGLKARPAALGSYLGLGSQIWARLLLSAWKLDEGDGLTRAAALAREIPDAVAGDDVLDVLSGRAGAIPALLALAERTGNAEFANVARGLGDELCRYAKRSDGRARWPHPNWPGGIGGFSHGASGTGWSLHILANAVGEDRYKQIAEEAFAFEESLFDSKMQNWRDLRQENERPNAVAAWCHGSIGIGLAHLDLDPYLALERTRSIVRRAVAATWQYGFGWNHCVCHGDFGAWELVDAGIAVGEGPAGVSRDELFATVITSLEDNGPNCGLFGGTFVPGLFPGVGGIVYQLLKAHPESDLPSILTLRNAFAVNRR